MVLQEYGNAIINTVITVALFAMVVGLLVLLAAALSGRADAVLQSGALGRSATVCERNLRFSSTDATSETMRVEHAKAVCRLQCPETGSCCAKANEWKQNDALGATKVLALLVASHGIKDVDKAWLGQLTLRDCGYLLAPDACYGLRSNAESFRPAGASWRRDRTYVEGKPYLRVPLELRTELGRFDSDDTVTVTFGTVSEARKSTSFDHTTVVIDTQDRAWKPADRAEESQWFSGFLERMPRTRPFCTSLRPCVRSLYDIHACAKRQNTTVTDLLTENGVRPDAELVAAISQLYDGRLCKVGDEMRLMTALADPSQKDGPLTAISVQHVPSGTRIPLQTTTGLEFTGAGVGLSCRLSALPASTTEIDLATSCDTPGLAGTFVNPPVPTVDAMGRPLRSGDLPAAAPAFLRSLTDFWTTCYPCPVENADMQRQSRMASLAVSAAQTRAMGAQ